MFGQITQKGPKYCPWPEQIKVPKIAKFCKKWQRRGRKIFVQLFCCETIQLFVISLKQSGNIDSKSMDAAGAVMARIGSQAKITMAKLENLKFTNENEFLK
jgi:hypothetical protein